MGLKTSTLTFEERCEKSLNDTQMQAALKKHRIVNGLNVKLLVQIWVTGKNGAN